MSASASFCVSACASVAPNTFCTRASVSARRMGLAHTSIAPYGVFKSKDDVPILISIQNDREWRVLATDVMGDAALAADPRFAKLVDRVKHRAETDGKVAAAFAIMDVATLSKKLEAADIAFARVNDVAGLIAHPHLRRIEVDTPKGVVTYSAPAPIFIGEDLSLIHI